MATEQKMEKPVQSPRGALWPILLIAIGLLLFGTNFGWLSWDALLGVLQLWPPALIAIGADILLKGRYRSALIMATVVIGAVLYVGSGGVLGFGGGAGDNVTVSQGLESAERAEVRLQGGVAQLRVNSLEGSDLLAEGTIQTRRGERITQAFRVEGGTAYFALESERQGASFMGSNRGRVWDLALTDSVPLALSVDTGVGESTLDLAEVQLTTFDMNTGVGATKLTLPHSGQYEATLDTGVGAATIRIPSGVAARIEVSRGLGAVSVDDAFEREGDLYTSPDYATAANRVDLRVSGGVGAITIERGD